MRVDPVRQLEVCADPFLHQIRMSFEEVRVHYQETNDELSVWPQSALVNKKAAVALVNQARGPWFGSPGGIEILLEEKGQLVGGGHGNNLHVAALIIRLHAMIFEPVAQSDILRVAELRRGDTLAVEILRPVDA